MASAWSRIGVLLAVVTVAAGGGAAVTGSFGAAPIDPDDVLMYVEVSPDGSATWLVEYRLRLDSENDTEAFESIAEDVRADPEGRAARFRGSLQPAVAAAENATGREMALRNVTATAERRQLPQSTGVVAYRFEWTDFAAVTDDGLRIGDALSGLPLDAEATLVVAWPAGYRLAGVTPGPDETRRNAVVWTGPRPFGPEEPRVRLAAATTAGDATTDAGTATSEAARVGGPDAVLPEAGAWLPVLAGAVALAALGGAWTVSRSDGEEPPAELLSDDERILHALEDNGGRMKQQALAEALDWSDPKTSRVVTRLADEGTVEVFRIGRENVVTTPTENGRLDP